ncbi:MAG: G5 domain-containing protein [Oscillospiraceae bacterium]|nr:G5 domain-containing protein [Oscillospiraceae bacterium]
MGKHYHPENRNAAPKTGNRRFRRITGVALALCAVGAAGAGSFATVLAQNTPVTSAVIDGANHYSVSLASTDADRLLQEAGITLSDDDMIVREENDSGITVTVKRKITADITVDGKTHVVEGYTGDTVGQLIEEAGLQVDALDEVTPSPSTQVWDDVDVSITEQKTVYIADNNVVRSYVVPAGTVSQAVQAAGIALGKSDSVENGKKQVENGMVISINRVTYETTKKTETVPFTVQEQQTDDLPVGETKLQTKGQNGKKQVTYRTKLVNGKAVKTEKIKETITKEAQEQIVLVGTKEPEPEATAASADGVCPVPYTSVISGSCTAYTGDGTTSTGMTPAVGVVAVNPDQIPYGTKLYIASPDGSYVYGYAVAGDTGGAMMSGQALCDLYMNTEGECIDFGRRVMNLYILS